MPVPIHLLIISVIAENWIVYECYISYFVKDFEIYHLQKEKYNISTNCLIVIYKLL